jgi:hypothetical protein
LQPNINQPVTTYVNSNINETYFEIYFNGAGTFKATGKPNSRINKITE